MVWTTKAYASPKKDETRCPEGSVFPAGMPHQSHMLHGNLSRLTKGQVRHQVHSSV